MRVIIAGSRTIGWECAQALVAEAVKESGFTITHVLSGRCRGIDEAGEEWADAHGIPWSGYPADWKRFGKAAGPKRNLQMAMNADALIAILDLASESRGTKGMIDLAKLHGLRVFIKEHPHE